MLKKYDELTETQKKKAREFRPNDYAEWWYQFEGVNIVFAAK